MAMRFLDKYALITGAGSGIGRAAALAFASEGAHLALVDQNAEGLEAVAAEVNAADRQALTFAVDLSDPNGVRTLFDDLGKQWSRLDIAVNNAGISGRPQPFMDVAVEDFDAIIQVNLKAVWLCMQEELNMMIPQKSGAIVNTASVAGLKGFPQYAAYAASKHAVVGLTKSVAFEIAALGIRVNAVCPGMTDTPMVSEVASDEVRRKVLKTIPMGRFGQPEEIAKLMLFLCSSDASFTTGQPYVASGGAFT
jgi:NAD(P)-dependent dehydrogenase (short-subunit alcohol dehydrogenase family)